VKIVASIGLIRWRRTGRCGETRLALHIDLVVIGLLYMAYPGTNFIPAEAKALPREGASALVLPCTYLAHHEALML